MTANTARGWKVALTIVKPPKPPENRKHPCLFPKIAAERLGSRVGGFDFRIAVSLDGHKSGTEIHVQIEFTPAMLRRFCKVGQKGQALASLVNGFLVPTATQRLLCGQIVKADGRHIIFATAMMKGELCGGFTEVTGISGFQSRGHTAM